MKTTIFIIIASCFMGTKTVAQDKIVYEEKASEWIKVTIAKPSGKTSIRMPQPGANKRVNPPVESPKPSNSEEFNKTNQQVKRFKKGKKE